MKDKLVIATRKSQLALWQAEWVKSELEKRYPGMTVELDKIVTKGDKITDVPLAQVGGKGLFTKEIEEALLSGEADLAVHSMKDVPTVFPDGLDLLCITEREDPRDVVISASGQGLMELPEGATVGTSSLRRRAQVKHVRPDIEIQDLRGNIDTRLRKAKEGMYGAVILAGAGIRRMGWADEITEYIQPDIMLPAIGQGALGIETRIDDEEVNELVSFFDHFETSTAVKAERALLLRLEGGCQVPIAAFATIAGDELRLKGLVASVNGETIVKEAIIGSTKDAEALGTKLAESLLKNGAYEILKELYDVAPAKA